MSLTGKLTKHHENLCEPTTLYRLDELQAKFPPQDLGGGYWLAIDDQDHLIYYAFFSFFLSDGDGANTMVQCQWAGSGTGPGLREMRHTWFSPDETPDCA